MSASVAAIIYRAALAVKPDAGFVADAARLNLRAFLR